MSDRKQELDKCGKDDLVLRILYLEKENARINLACDLFEKNSANAVELEKCLANVRSDLLHWADEIAKLVPEKKS